MNSQSSINLYQTISNNLMQLTEKQLKDISFQAKIIAKQKKDDRIQTEFKNYDETLKCHLKTFQEMWFKHAHDIFLHSSEPIDKLQCLKRGYLSIQSSEKWLRVRNFECEICYN
jgi:hypothetical protein